MTPPSAHSEPGDTSHSLNNSPPAYSVIFASWICSQICPFLSLSTAITVVHTGIISFLDYHNGLLLFCFPLCPASAIHSPPIIQSDLFLKVICNTPTPALSLQWFIEVRIKAIARPARLCHLDLPLSHTSSFHPPPSLHQTPLILLLRVLDQVAPYPCSHPL